MHYTSWQIRATWEKGANRFPVRQHAPQHKRNELPQRPSWSETYKYYIQKMLGRKTRSVRETSHKIAISVTTEVTLAK